MSVYRVEAGKASCCVSGCACHDRAPRYPSDVADAQWALLRPEAEAVMAELRRSPAGRAMEHDLRAMLDGIGYVARYGIEWRALPVDFPPWEAVYAFFERWSARGLPQRLVDRLRGRLRVTLGRAELPTAGSIDSQSVKAADTVGAASRGYDGGKKINGRKRHLAVDTLGLVLTVIVTAASVQDRDGAFRLLTLLRERFSTISLVWADGGYAGRLLSWAHTVLALTVTIVKRSDDTTGFVVLPRRWVVERTFGWLLRYRRLVRDYERVPQHHEAMVLWAAVTIMTPATGPRHGRSAASSPMGPTSRHSVATRTTRSASRVTICQQVLIDPGLGCDHRHRVAGPWRSPYRSCW
jgi:transposase